MQSNNLMGLESVSPQFKKVVQNRPGSAFVTIIEYRSTSLGFESDICNKDALLMGHATLAKLH